MGWSMYAEIIFYDEHGNYLHHECLSSYRGGEFVFSSDSLHSFSRFYQIRLFPEWILDQGDVSDPESHLSLSPTMDSK